MRNTRIHVAAELTSEHELLMPAAASAHLLRVLRLRVGAALTLFNGQGGEYSAELIGTDKSGARVRIGAFDSVERESPLQLTLLQGIARGERMDLIVQKATELGVNSIVPLSCEFSVVRLAAHALARRRERWQAVAISACEQCGRNRPPLVEPIVELAAACAAITAGDASLRLMLVPEASESFSALARGSLRSAVLLVGPEGGLSGREQLLAQRAGFRACRLGPRTLRTETAPLAALAALQALVGDLAS